MDSSVLIDWFRNVRSLQVERLEKLLYPTTLLLGDLVLAEVLQGCRDERHASTMQFALRALHPIVITDFDIARLAAANYRTLRARGITVRKTIDTLIATRCIVDDVPLLFSDRDFEPFVAHLGLRDAMAEPV